MRTSIADVIYECWNTEFILQPQWKHFKEIKYDGELKAAPIPPPVFKPGIKPPPLCYENSAIYYDVNCLRNTRVHILGNHRKKERKRIYASIMQLRAHAKDEISRAIVIKQEGLSCLIKAMDTWWVQRERGGPFTPLYTPLHTLLLQDGGR